MSTVDGRKMADEILKKLVLAWPKLKKPVTLGVVLVGDDPASSSFVLQKQKAAETVGVHYMIYKFPHKISTARLKKALQKLLKKHSAWIVQLPLPRHINEREVLEALPLFKDVDVLSTHAWLHFLGGGPILPPAVGAVAEIFKQYRIKPKAKTVAVVGFGRLVGQPVAYWLALQKAKVVIINEGTKNRRALLKKADIIVSGVGKPKLIKGADVKRGVVIIDFGFAKKDGRISGDVDFKSVAHKAKLITPVPGGVGPLTVAVLIRNVMMLAISQK